MLRFAKTLLHSAGLYERVKMSGLYLTFWRIARPTLATQLAAERRFYADLLASAPRSSRVFDIGANFGWKTNIFRHLGFPVLAVDPDPFNTRRLRRAFNRLRLHSDRVIVLECAISSQTGEASFWLEAPGSAKNTITERWVSALEHDNTRFGRAVQFESRRTVATKTLDDLIHAYGAPVYIKIDIEGNEAAAIAGLSIPVPLLSIEVNLPEFLPDAITSVRRLEQLCPDTRFRLANSATLAWKSEEWITAAEIERLLARVSLPCVELFARTNRRPGCPPL